jgi:formate dehydrogenase iron-sulfur subunit
MMDVATATIRKTAFLTDATICIGCKACEVACKEWNEVPEDGLVWSGMSYDNTKSLGASTWRHVLFIEEMEVAGPQVADTEDPFRWIFLSDVCKHCARAGCLEACPTGSIVRTEFGSVFVQPDVCNGCGYCVVSCPFGVIDKRPTDGRAFKCTFCYDRQKAGLTPACAKACPTQSIQFGDLETLRERGKERVQELQKRGYQDARIYDPQETSVGGIHAFFVILGEPEAYNLPPAPEVPTAYLKSAWTSALVSAAILLAVVCAAFAF